MRSAHLGAQTTREVNNAGILTRGAVDDFPLDDFDRMIAVNVRAVFVAIQAAVPHMTSGD